MILPHPCGCRRLSIMPRFFSINDKRKKDTKFYEMGERELGDLTKIMLDHSLLFALGLPDVPKISFNEMGRFRTKQTSQRKRNLFNERIAGTRNWLAPELFKKRIGHFYGENRTHFPYNSRASILF